VAVAESLGQRRRSLSTLMHGLHHLGKLKDAEHHHHAYLLRADLTLYARAVTLNSLSRVLRDQGKLNEALEKAEEATALATTIPKDSLPVDNQYQLLMENCHQSEASILERMGRLKEAIAKDQLIAPTSGGQLVRSALAAVVEGRLVEARDLLRYALANAPEGDHRESVEGPDLVLRAKELMCQVLHSLREAGGRDPRDEAEEAALRAELRHEEARRGEALTEIRALIRRAAGAAGEGEEEETEAPAGAVTVAPKTSRKKNKNKNKKKGKRGSRSRAAAAPQQEDEKEDAVDGDAAAAVAALQALELGDAAAVGQAPTMGDDGPAADGEQVEDKDDCPVCLQPLGAEDGEEEEGVLILCGHEFHVTCLDAWVSTCVRKKLDVTCPSCRAPVSR
jgi:tetratricopeptide (TPR) repeat protein